MSFRRFYTLDEDLCSSIFHQSNCATSRRRHSYYSGLTKVSQILFAVCFRGKSFISKHFCNIVRARVGYLTNYCLCLAINSNLAFAWQSSNNLKTDQNPYRISRSPSPRTIQARTSISMTNPTLPVVTAGESPTNAPGEIVESAQSLLLTTSLLQCRLDGTNDGAAESGAASTQEKMDISRTQFCFSSPFLRVYTRRSLRSTWKETPDHK